MPSSLRAKTAVRDGGSLSSGVAPGWAFLPSPRAASTRALLPDPSVAVRNSPSVSRGRFGPDAIRSYSSIGRPTTRERNESGRSSAPSSQPSAAACGGGRTSYRLGYPNREVREGLNEHLLQAIGWDAARAVEARDRIYDLLHAADFAGMETHFRALFAGIPYNWHTRNDVARFECLILIENTSVMT